MNFTVQAGLQRHNLQLKKADIMSTEKRDRLVNGFLFETEVILNKLHRWSHCLVTLLNEMNQGLSSTLIIRRSNRSNIFNINTTASGYGIKLQFFNTKFVIYFIKSLFLTCLYIKITFILSSECTFFQSN